MLNKTKHKARLWVVIHCLNGNGGLEHSVYMAKIAEANGADGVMLIPDYAKNGSRASTENIIEYFAAIRKDLPSLKIGVNFLLKDIRKILPKIYSLRPSMLQCDGVIPDELDMTQLPDTLLLPGLAFKYTNDVNVKGYTLKELCESVSLSEHVIPTTSGDKTGTAASLEKILSIRQYLNPSKRLGLASGVTGENIQGYLNAGVTDFLVATSLLKYVDNNGFDILDPKKVAKLADIIQIYNQRTFQ